MPPKKPMMNDMVPVKKTALKKQVFVEKEKKIEKVQRPIEREESVERFVEQPEEIFKNPVGYSQLPENKKRGGCVLWLIAIICVVALVVGIGGLFTEATIRVTPKKFQGTVDMSMPLSLNKTPDGVSFATAVRTFTEEKIIPATAVTGHESFASGTVRIYNTGVAKTISKGTVIVSTTKKQYSISKNVTVPAMKGKVLGQVDVKVIAVVAGSDSNNDLDDFTLLKVDKTSTSLKIHSVTPMTGGASGSDAIADPVLVAQAADELRAKLTNSSVLIKRMSEEIPNTSMVLPVTFPTTAPVITTEANHADGVHVIAKENVTILLVDRNEIARALGKNLQAPEGVKLTLPTFDGLTVTTSSIASNLPIPNTIQVRITGQTTVRGVIDESQVVTKVKGSYRVAARKILSETPEIDSFQIRMRPFWRRTLPSSPDDISVAFDL